MIEYKLKSKQYLGYIVYTIFLNDTILYVGYSSIGLSRCLQHEFLKQSTSITVALFSNELSARAYEETLIRIHNPVYNKVFNFDRENNKFCMYCNKLLLNGRSDRIYCSPSCKAAYNKLLKELGPKAGVIVHKFIKKQNRHGE